MPFDPTLPQTNSPIASAELRDQFNGQKELIDASAWTDNGADIYYNGAIPASASLIPQPDAKKLDQFPVSAALSTS